jgi:hypothetical protein
MLCQLSSVSQSAENQTKNQNHPIMEVVISNEIFERFVKKVEAKDLVIKGHNQEDRDEARRVVWVLEKLQCLFKDLGDPLKMG